MLRLLTRLLCWPRKHRYECLSRTRMYSGESITVFRCRYCRHIRHMDGWQASTLSWEEARCFRGQNLKLVEIVRVWLAPEYSMVNCNGAE